MQSCVTDYWQIGQYSLTYVRKAIFQLLTQDIIPILVICISYKLLYIFAGTLILVESKWILLVSVKIML